MPASEEKAFSVNLSNLKVAILYTAFYFTKSSCASSREKVQKFNLVYETANANEKKVNRDYHSFINYDDQKNTINLIIKAITSPSQILQSF